MLLPVVLYPLMFLGQGWLEDVAEESLESKQVDVVLALDAAPPDLAAAIRAGIEERGPATLRDAGAGELAGLEAARPADGDAPTAAEREAARALLGQDGDALLVAASRGDDRLAFRVYADRADDVANAARDRIGETLEELEAARAEARVTELLGDDPAAALELATVDVASEEDRGGLALGKLLPLISVLVVLSGASFAALAAFAGEREAGTLEALLVQPVTPTAIARGKLLAICGLGVVTLVLNLASVLGCLAAGLGQLPGAAAGSSLALGLPRLAAAAALLLPAVVLLCAALALVAVRARTFREGQHYVFPLVMASALPVALGSFGDLDLDLLLALVPLTGATMAMRDALSGDLVPWLGVAAFLSHCGWAWLVASRVAPRLEAERLLSTRDVEEEAGRRRLASRTALRFGWAAVIGLYLLGGFLQSRSAVWGLAATLWLLLLPLAVAAAWRVARRTGEGLASAMNLRAPRAAHVAGALLVAPALAQAMAIALGWQERVLPLPQGPGRGYFPAELLELSLAWKVALLALTPALCEEAFFRGPLLSGLRRDLSAAACVGWQALLFGLAHASIHRLLPTAILGALLAVLVLRTRSLWVAIALHGAYNAWLVTGEANPWFDAGWAAGLAAPGVALLLVSRGPTR